MTPPQKSVPAMKELEPGKWHYPIGDSETDFSDEHFDSEDAAKAAWVQKFAVSTAKGPKEQQRLTAVEIVRRGRGGGGIGD